MKRTLTILFMTLGLVTLINNQSLAVIADPNPKTIVQPDGSKLTIIQRGDEYFNWATTVDGYTLMKNIQGVYEYAINNKNGYLMPSGLKAVDADTRKSATVSFLTDVPKYLEFSTEQVNEEIQNSPIYSPNSKRGGFPTTGENKLLMVLGNFADTDTSYSQQNFRDYMNTPGGVDGKGSFKDYYTEVSYGQLNMTTVVTIWVTVPHGHDYYGPDDKWAEFAHDAIVAADSTGIDFSQFDNNGDGVVDGIAVIHQGKGQEATSDESDIWSHSWNLRYAGYSYSQRTFDGVEVDAYTLQPEQYGSGMSTIGVMCHEFGHNLGAPDYYDTNYEEGGSYSGTGRWDLMAGGSWNGNPGGSSPAHFNMFQKLAYGWLTKTELTTNNEVTILPAENNKEAYYFKSPENREYFLLENRQKTGFDASLPGHGLIIYHVDEGHINQFSGSNSINTGKHQGLYPKAASGSINSAGCPFPGSHGITEFSDFTEPNSLTWSGLYTKKPMYNIQENDSVISFTIYAKEIEEVIWKDATPGSDNVRLEWKNNTNNDSVLLVWGFNKEFSSPEAQTLYEVNDTLPGGEQVLYFGNTDSLQMHWELVPGINYFYKLFVYSNGFYSQGLVQENTTNCVNFYDSPYQEGFEHFRELDPGLCWSIMRNTEQNGGLNGDSLVVVSQTNNDETWFVNNNSMENGETYIFDGEKSMYINQSATDYNWLISPKIKLSSGYADLQFYTWYVTSVRNVSFNVLVKSENEWTNVLEWYDAPTNDFNEEVTVNLDEFAGQIVQLAFVYKGENSFRMAIDEISVNGGTGIRPYDITYLVLADEEPLKNASVTFYGTEQFTDSLGYTTFVDVLPADDMAYTINMDGFTVQNGTLDVSGTDTTLTIKLWKVGVDETRATIGEIYPNPAQNALYIKANIPNSKFTLYSLTGAIVKSGGLEKGVNELGLNGLTQGVYLIEISSSMGKSFERLIIE